MAFFEWEQRYSVGTPLIDRHHNMLVSYVNRLAEALQAGTDGAELGALLQELATYTKMHFSYEEALLDQYEYGDRANHREYHRNLVHRVDDFCRRY